MRRGLAVLVLGEQPFFVAEVLDRVIGQSIQDRAELLLSLPSDHGVVKGIEQFNQLFVLLVDAGQTEGERVVPGDERHGAAFCGQIHPPIRCIDATIIGPGPQSEGWVAVEP